MHDAVAAINLGMRKAGLRVPEARHIMPINAIVAIQRLNPDRREQQPETDRKERQHVHRQASQNKDTYTTKTQTKEARPQQMKKPTKQTPTKSIRRPRTWTR